MSDVMDATGQAHGEHLNRLAGSLAKRHRRERAFRLLGLLTALFAVSLVALLFVSIVQRGLPAFWQATFTLNVHLDPQAIDVPPLPRRAPGQSAAAYDEAVLAWQSELALVDWYALVEDAIVAVLPEAAQAPREARRLIARTERYKLRDIVAQDPARIGTNVRVDLLASANVDVWLKGNIDRTLPDAQQQLTANQRVWADRLEEAGIIRMAFSSALFLNPDSRSSPATAGLAGAFMGSLMMLLVVIVLAVPLGVGAAIYLEEFAPKNRTTDLIEVNINNLAAVPSIIFGLLGAAIFIRWFGLPLSAPIVGGLVLTLMTLPTVIIATRSALRAVPPSIRDAALGIGASRVQMMFHHVLPVAVPGILTGAIIGVAQALGETAPLLLIGMNAFVANVPATPFDQSTALPVQIFLWQGHENRNFFEERTSAAIMVLLALMLALNALAIVLRQRFQRRW
jgi:phosphate transport system permease protein